MCLCMCAFVCVPTAPTPNFTQGDLFDRSPIHEGGVVLGGDTRYVIRTDVIFGALADGGDDTAVAAAAAAGD